MTKNQFKQTVRIYKHHILANGLISITYAHVLGRNTVSSERTIIIDKNGGALNSLYIYLGC